LIHKANLSELDLKEYLEEIEQIIKILTKIVKTSQETI